ncbi:MAG: radical SAM protein [Deltaproteobacteria bacterium]|nr:radical SAM protein [Deltaproteobacteria bacterium]
MRLALVGPTLEENLSLEYLVAALRGAGHEASLVPFAWDRDLPRASRAILALRPDAVGLSMTFQMRGRSFLALAAELRARGFSGPIVAGGHWASLAAGEVLRDHPAVDFILRGEAERSIVAFAAALSGEGDLDGVPGLVRRVADGALRESPVPPERLPLDELAPPARDAAPLERIGIPWAPILAGRGCRGQCTFCSIGAFHRLGRGPTRRVRSPERVADEMAALWRERGVRIFVFHDDDFFLGRLDRDLERLERLGEAMAARGLPRVALVVKARPDDIHEEVVRRLRALGLVRIFLGIENDAPAGLRALGRGVDPQRNHRAVAVLRRHDVFTCSNLLAWEPDATLEDLRANIDLLRAFPDNLFNFGRTELYEAAPLTLRLAAEGRLRGDYLARDYVVSDPRAELAFRVYRVALGERCYPLDGLVNASTSLGYDAALLAHFHPGDRAERVRAEVGSFLRRLSGSLAAWLECIVDACATATLSTGPDVARFTLDVARAVRAEDVRMAAELRALQASIERSARGLPEPVAPRAAAPRRGPRRAAAFLAAAGGALACSKSGTSARNPPEAIPPVVPAQVDAAGGSAAEAEPADAGGAPEAAVSPIDAATESDAVVLSISTDVGPWQSCPANAHVASFIVGVVLEDPAVEARFERFDATDGRVEDLYVSPDGRRAHAMFHAGGARGVQKLTAVFARAAGAGTLVHSQQFFEYGDGEATLGPDEYPDVECGVICDPMAIPPDAVLDRGDEVVFGREPWGNLEGWATNFTFSAGLRADLEGEVVGTPAVECSTGSASVGGEWSMGIGEPRPGETWVAQDAPRVASRVFRIQFDPRPPDGDGRLAGGDHTCTVRFTVRKGDDERTYEGRIRIHVAPDGTVEIGPAQPAPAEGVVAPPSARRDEGLPLPHRYAVELRCLADYGEALLLEALAPAADSFGKPSFRWSASGGSIEAVDGGARALWRLPDDAGPATAVCAVAAHSADLQVGSYRRG